MGQCFHRQLLDDMEIHLLGHQLLLDRLCVVQNLDDLNRLGVVQNLDDLELHLDELPLVGAHLDVVVVVLVGEESHHRSVR
jgi:hypothetical protein